MTHDGVEVKLFLGDGFVEREDVEQLFNPSATEVEQELGAQLTALDSDDEL